MIPLPRLVYEVLYYEKLLKHLKICASFILLEESDILQDLMDICDWLIFCSPFLLLLTTKWFCAERWEEGKQHPSLLNFGCPK